jgi:short-subunit dehydrogenase
MAKSGDNRANAPGYAVVVGNSDGIGLALTRLLLAEEWTVTGVSRSPGRLTHHQYRHEVADVGAPDYLDRLTKAIGERDPDLVVFTVGVGEFVDVTDLAEQTRTLDVNLLGAARTLEAVVPRLVAAGRGHIMALSSLSDVTVSGVAPAYAASKAGLTSYLLGLRIALRPHGVPVTVVRFGFVDTKMAKSPSKPFLITPERAAEVLMRAVYRRPAVVSYPRRMAVLTRLLRPLTMAQARRPGQAGSVARSGRG